MRIINVILKVIGVLFLLLIVADGVLIWKQTTDAEEACSINKAKQVFPGIEKLKEQYSSLNIVGPLEQDGMNGAQGIIMCAGATLCDAFCRISYKNGEIVESKYVKP